MGSERNLSAVAPILLTTNGGTEGQLTLQTTLGLFVKQTITLQDTLSPPNILNVQVKFVVNETQILVGPIPPSSLAHRTNVSAFLVANGAFVFAQAQEKALISMENRMLGSYIQEPSNSWRVTPVDSFGNSFDSTHPLPVEFDGTITIGDVSIVEGGNTMTVNSDGSTNTISLAQLIPYKFDEIDLTNSVIAGQTVVTVATYKQMGATVATLNLTYDGSANLLSVVRTPS